MRRGVAWVRCCVCSRRTQNYEPTKPPLPEHEWRCVDRAACDTHRRATITAHLELAKACQ